VCVSPTDGKVVLENKFRKIENFAVFRDTARCVCVCEREREREKDVGEVVEEEKTKKISWE